MKVFDVSYGIVVSHDTLRNRIMLKSFACSSREINWNKSHVNQFLALQNASWNLHKVIADTAIFV